MVKGSKLQIVVVFVLLAFAGCTGRDDAFRETQVGDSTITEAVTVSLVAGDVERALAIVDSAEAAGALGGFHAELLRC